MEHIAILKKAKIKKSDNLLQDIIDGTKTIESRWYVNKISPWNRIKPGETIYFKNSGSPVTAKALISKVIQYENLDQPTIKQIIQKYGKKIAPHSTQAEFYTWVIKQIDKRYCILVFVKNARQIKPFNINKKGFGNSSAWLVVKKVRLVKIS